VQKLWVRVSEIVIWKSRKGTLVTAEQFFSIEYRSKGRHIKSSQTVSWKTGNPRSNFSRVVAFVDCPLFSVCILHVKNHIIFTFTDGHLM
jgi:hypothetical protein